MSGFKMEQKRLLHRGREFHFVSYEGVLANPVKAVPATPAAWFLMQGGKRWMVMPLVKDQAPEAVDKGLIQWLESHIFQTSAAVSR
ncbi:MAG TPA: hypothetical protein VGP61_12975 [Gemmatimonadales bacterium]|jgi:hypothetical protein|nr:hypothetical protein [Gemmatimonadales bacterium]